MFFSLLLAVMVHAVDQDATLASLRRLQARLIDLGVDGVHQVHYGVRHSSVQQSVNVDLDPATHQARPFGVAFHGGPQGDLNSALVIKPLSADLMIKDMSAHIELNVSSPDMLGGGRRTAARTEFARELYDLVPDPHAQITLHLRFEFDHNWQVDQTGGYNLSEAPRMRTQLWHMLRLDEVNERLRRQFNSPKISVKMTTLMTWSSLSRDVGPTSASVSPMVGLTLKVPPGISQLDAYVALYLHAFEALTSTRPRALPLPAGKPNLLTRLLKPRACAPALEIVPQKGSTALVVQQKNGGPPPKGGVVTFRTPLGDLDIYLTRFELRRGR